MRNMDIDFSSLNENIPVVANNLTTTAAGYALDARQGKTLNDRIANGFKTHMGDGRIILKYDDATGKVIIAVDNTDIITISRGEK